MIFRVGFSIKYLVIDIIGLYELCIIIRALLSWFADPYGGTMRFLVRLTEPAITPVRNVINRLIGTWRIDISPAVTVILLEILRRAVLTIFR